MSHHDSTPAGSKIKPQAMSKYAMWFVFLLVGLIIALINFINVMSHH